MTHLESTGRLQVNWLPENGLLRCELTEEHKALLSVSQVIFTNNVEVVPFNRFLQLRFLQLPIDEQYQELIDRNIIDSAHFSLERLGKLRSNFITKLPLVLQRLAQIQKAPESEEEKKLYSLLLDVCELTLAYEHPELEQSFVFMPIVELKECVDCSISTKSSFVDIHLFLKQIGLDISVEGLAFYQQLFHDLNILNIAQFKSYLHNIKPSLRAKINLATQTDLETFKLKSGYDNKLEVDKVLNVLKDNLIDNLVGLINTKTPESEKTFHYNLKSLMIILDRLDLIGNVKPSALKSQRTVTQRTITIEPQAISDLKIFQLPEDTVKKVM